MSAPTVEIVIPIYKSELNTEEMFSVDRTFQILSSHPLTFFAPIGLDVGFYAERYPIAKFKFFEKKYFASIQDYSRLLVQLEFYDAFADKDFLLIVQPDVYVFRDDLAQWLNSPYDYVAAPWPNGLSLNIKIGKFLIGNEGRTYTTYVGNGGFSLRRISKCKLLIAEHKDVADWFMQSGSAEDLFFSFMGALSVDFFIPNQIAASLFSMEIAPEYFCHLNGGKLPMGAHAYTQYSQSFWQTHIQNHSEPDALNN
jgi:hypothetical protein